LEIRFILSLTFAANLLIGSCDCARSAENVDADQHAAVRVVDNGDTYTLDNGILTATIVKRNGALSSLIYKKIETLASHGGAERAGGNWSHDPSGTIVDHITIDPKSNGGARGEVSIKGISGGKPSGGGPGGTMIADIEIRYTLARGDSGLYTYCSFEHKPSYPATSIGEARFYVKLNDAVFDWMTVDADRNLKMITTYDWDHGTPMNMKEARLMNSGIYKGQVEHKYDYSACQFDTLAWGWSSTDKHIGLFFVNPTIEYLSGGPTKMELSAHRDATFTSSLTAAAPPCLLNYWRGSHYGGSSCVIAQGEEWKKVVGPFVVDCDSGPTPDAIWKDALARSKVEEKQWPYDWVSGVDYPHRDERSTVTGELSLDDPQAPAERMSHLLVGLTAPDYTTTGTRGRTTNVDWQLDAKHYEFWTRGDVGDDGKAGHFSIPAVRAGRYTLHAIADGVLGEFAQANVTVEPGKALDLGHLTWKPVRFGKQLWDIGVPNRSASEFKHGDHYWVWGLYNLYPKEFPDDVNFTIGQSDYHTDWNYAQLPRADRPNGTTWSVIFNLPQAIKGKATLRLALCGISAKHIDVSINDQPAGTTGPLTDNATIRRDSVRGYWSEHDIPFDASLMKSGRNVLKLTIPPGGVMSGIEYDYVRLEYQPS
jgi:rhamnogalacturonan endolyase